MMEALSSREVGQFVFITSGAKTLSHLLVPVMLFGKAVDLLFDGGLGVGLEAWEEFEE